LEGKFLPPRVMNGIFEMQEEVIVVGDLLGFLPVLKVNVNGKVESCITRFLDDIRRFLEDPFALREVRMEVEDHFLDKLLDPTVVGSLDQYSPVVGEALR